MASFLQETKKTLTLIAHNETNKQKTKHFYNQKLPLERKKTKKVDKEIKNNQPTLVTKLKIIYQKYISKIIKT